MTEDLIRVSRWDRFRLWRLDRKHRPKVPREPHPSTTWSKQQSLGAIMTRGREGRR